MLIKPGSVDDGTNIGITHFVHQFLQIHLEKEQQFCTNSPNLLLKHDASEYSEYFSSNVLVHVQILKMNPLSSLS